MILKANCKINIGLDVLRKREDGYHDLDTVMVPVDGLYDVIEVEPLPQDFIFEQRGLVVDCSPEDNICMKACWLMRRRFGIGGAKVTLDKRIPFGAGLGGGSSDATSTLLALNSLYGLQLSEDELISLASELGSDTAFFVLNSPQICRGRGEVMSPIELPLQGLWLLLVKPDVKVSTREAYAGVKPALPEIPLTERLQSPIAEWQGSVKNDFERSVFAAHPELSELKQQLLGSGAIYASMSGSGSSIFALYESCPEPLDGYFCHIQQFK